MSKCSLLLVDDEEDILDSLETGLNLNYQIYKASDRAGALAIVRKVKVDLILLDLRLGDEDGLVLYREIKKLSPETVVALFTGYADIEMAVNALHQGIHDVITKPICLSELRARLDKSLNLWKNRPAIAALNCQAPADLPSVITISDSMRQLMNEVRTLANIPSPVLITGESGTGKEIVARALHAWGIYADRPFIALNCSAIPGNLIESEMFGTEKGAYTGAVSMPGKIEYAGDGILFLDEIGDMPVSLQASLLRVLDGHAFCRLGSNREIPVRARFIAATNRDLHKAVAEGKFREDLYYRLNVVNLHIPPLRQRKTDIPVMLNNFIADFQSQYGIKREMSLEDLKLLKEYDFPGNVRELRSVVERFILTGRLGINFNKRLDQTDNNKIIPLAQYVNNYIAKVCNISGGDTKKASVLLGITEKTVKKKLQILKDEASSS